MSLTPGRRKEAYLMSRELESLDKSIGRLKQLLQNSWRLMTDEVP